MALTAPGGISNSSSKSFSNLYGRISIDNYNILKGSISTYDFYANAKTQQHFASNKYPKFKPLSIGEVIKSTKLYK